MVEKELKEAQEEVDSLQAAKRSLEAQLDDQKKQLRSLNIEVNTLRGELDSQSHKSRSSEGKRMLCSSDDSRQMRQSDNSYSTRYSDEPRQARQSENTRQARQTESTMVVYNRQPDLPRRDDSHLTVSALLSLHLQAIALYDYEGNRDFNSLPMRKGQEMTVIKYNNSHDWAFVSFNGVTTWEPSSYLRVTENRAGGSERPSKTHSREIISGVGSQRAIVIADFEGIDRSEMTVKKGEIVQIVKEDGEWLFGTVGARVRDIEESDL